MLPKYRLSTKDRTCKTTPRVHHDVSKINSFYEKNGLWGDNTVTYVYVPSLISIPFLLFKIWPGQDKQKTFMKTWLMGEN